MKIIMFVGVLLITVFVMSGPICAQDVRAKLAKLDEIRVMKAARLYERHMQVWMPRSRDEFNADVKTTYAIMMKGLESGKISASYYPYLSKVYEYPARKEVGGKSKTK